VTGHRGYHPAPVRWATLLYVLAAVALLGCNGDDSQPQEDGARTQRESEKRPDAPDVLTASEIRSCLQDRVKLAGPRGQNAAFADVLAENEEQIEARFVARFSRTDRYGEGRDDVSLFVFRSVAPAQEFGPAVKERLGQIQKVKRSENAVAIIGKRSADLVALLDRCLRIDPTTRSSSE